MGIQIGRIHNLSIGGSAGRYWKQYWASKLDTRYIGMESADLLIPISPVIMEDDDIYYKYDTFHAEYARDNKVLAYSNDILYLSYDAGYSYQKSIAFVGCADISRSKIYANGNIGWWTKNKAYVSTNDLSTYNEVIIKDIDGTDWTPTGNADGQSFRELTRSNPVIIGDVEYDVFGNYGNSLSSTDNACNVYATTDSGITQRIIYKFDGIAPNVMARHIHAVVFNPNNNKFLIHTGDTTDNCHWIYLDKDTWVATVLATGDETSWFKSIGGFFDANNFYWGADVTGDTNKLTIWKVPIADMLDNTKYVNLYYELNTLSSDFYMNSSGEILSGTTGITGGHGRELLISKDSGTTVIKKIITLANAAAHFYRITPKNINGWFRMDSKLVPSDSFNCDVVWVKLK